MSQNPTPSPDAAPPETPAGGGRHACCAYLSQEIDRARKSLRYGAIALVVVAVALVFIFSQLRGQVREITAPKNLAEFAVNEVRRNLPAARDALERNLTKAAPDLVRFIGETLLKETVPMLRTAVEGMFRDYARELTHYSVQASERIFEEIIKRHRDELRKRVAAEPGIYTADRLATDLDRALSLEMNQKLSSQPRESTRFKLDRSLVALNNINARLRRMADKPGKSRKDVLGRRLITAWWSLLQRTDVQESPSDRMLQQTRIPRVPTRPDKE